jgi:uncharacterized membrane protein YedE/YeeE
MLITSIPLLYCVGLLLGLVAGFVMHRSDYCVAAMFRDLFLFRTAAMLRILLWQIVVTMVFFEIARRLGWLPLYPFPLLGSPSLANVAGGFLFGIGMVLAGGCVVGTLYKMGAGSVASGLAFVGLILGSGLYAEFHPWWGAFSKLAAMAETVVAPAHVARVGYFQLVPLKVTEPVSGAVLQGGPGAGIDFLWAIQFPLIVGIDQG